MRARAGGARSTAAVALARLASVRSTPLGLLVPWSAMAQCSHIENMRDARMTHAKACSHIGTGAIPSLRPVRACTGAEHCEHE